MFKSGWGEFGDTKFVQYRQNLRSEISSRLNSCFSVFCTLVDVSVEWGSIRSNGSLIRSNEAILLKFSRMNLIRHIFLIRVPCQSNGLIRLLHSTKRCSSRETFWKILVKIKIFRQIFREFFGYFRVGDENFSGHPVQPKDCLEKDWRWWLFDWNLSGKSDRLTVTGEHFCFSSALMFQLWMRRTGNIHLKIMSFTSLMSNPIVHWISRIGECNQNTKESTEEYRGFAIFMLIFLHLWFPVDRGLDLKM